MEKTLKTSIQKNLPKFQKFARKIIYSYIFFFFAVCNNFTYDSEA